MTTRRFTQQYGYIALLLALAFVCAIPLIHAHSIQDQWSDQRKTSGWAWVGADSLSVQGDNVKARSEHQWGFLNKTGKKVSITVGYDHKLQKNGQVVDNDSITRTLEVRKPKDGETEVYVSTSDFPGSYIRSTSTPKAPGTYTFQPYTKVTYGGKAEAKAQHPVVELKLK